MSETEWTAFLREDTRTGKLSVNGVPEEVVIELTPTRITAIHEISH